MKKLQADSLMHLIADNPGDTSKVIKLLTLAGLRLETEKTNIQWITEAQTLAEKLHFKQGVALANKEFGAIYQDKKEYKTAIKYYELALDQATILPYTNQEPEFFSPLLNLYF